MHTMLIVVLVWAIANVIATEWLSRATDGMSYGRSIANDLIERVFGGDPEAARPWLRVAVPAAYFFMALTAIPLFVLGMIVDQEANEQ